MDIFTFILIVAVFAVVQVYLSTRKPVWPGLLPGGLFFAFTLYILLRNGLDPEISFWQNVLARLVYLIVFNLPTAVMLFYHFWSRSPKRRFNAEKAAQRASRPEPVLEYTGPKKKKKKGKKKKSK